MQGINGIVQHKIKDYGYICAKLVDMRSNRNIPRNHLPALTGAKYDVIGRYDKRCNIALADLNFLAKVCRVSDCQVSNLPEYILTPK